MYNSLFIINLELHVLDTVVNLYETLALTKLDINRRFLLNLLKLHHLTRVAEKFNSMNTILRLIQWNTVINRGQYYTFFNHQNSIPRTL